MVAQENRGGRLKTVLPTAQDTDVSFIVFSNDVQEASGKKAGPKQTSHREDAGDASKKPDIKKLIGGASWTGKLPVNILSEHCQKQKWEKPEYTMVITARITPSIQYIS